jgi:drug/metabolite transporter (DMT)-like permease
VNPVVAVILGYFGGGEAIGPRMLAGAILVLISVIAITTTPKKSESRKHAEVAVAEAD